MGYSPDPLLYVPPAAQVSDAAAASEPQKQVVRGYALAGFTSDGKALGKMAIIRDQVVRPALTGAGLVYTRGVLAEILRGAPAGINGHRAGLWPTAQRIFTWFRGRVRYVLDPQGVELFQTLPVTIKEGQGDCDDMTGALAALCKAAGLRAKARCVAVKAGGPYVHIYPLVLDGWTWRALDATTPNPPGWETKYARCLDLEL